MTNWFQNNCLVVCMYNGIEEGWEWGDTEVTLWEAKDKL